MKHKLVVAVREDLRLSPGKLAVQVAHAAVACVLEARRRRSKWLGPWLAEGQRKVVVRVPGYGDLLELRGAAAARGLVAELVTDAGLTEVPPGTTTCIGIGPGPEEIVDGVTGHLKLL